MKKRWSVLCSLLLVLVLAVSFSVPVFASTTSASWTENQGAYNGVTSKNQTHVASYVDVSTGQYIKKVDPNTGSTAYSTLGYYYGYIRLRSVPSVTGYQYRIRNLSLTQGALTNVIGFSYLIGTAAEVVDGTAQVLSGTISNTNIFYYDGNSSGVYIWLRVLVFGSLMEEKFTVSSVAVSYDSVERRLFGTPVALNYALNDIIKMLTSQTSSLSSAISSQTTALSSSISSQTTSINKNITQETQKQTTTLTTGYDNKGMTADNNRLSGSLNQYDNTESQITDQSIGYIDAVTFVDPSTNLSLLTSITYTSTFLQDLFVALGDWSILVMVSLSIAFALMLVGWYKYRK